MRNILCKKLSLASICSVFLLFGCTGVPAYPDATPEFRKQMEGKTLAEAKGSPSLWGQTEESIATKVFPGKSTKSDIKRIFGSTTKINLTDITETWTYESSVVTIFSGSSYTQNTLVILFDEQGIVKRYSMNSDVK